MNSSEELNKSKTGALNSTKSTMLKITSFCLCLFFIFFNKSQKEDVRFRTLKGSFNMGKLFGPGLTSWILCYKCITYFFANILLSGRTSRKPPFRQPQ